MLGISNKLSKCDMILDIFDLCTYIYMRDQILLSGKLLTIHVTLII